jgi:hypothetical protein
MSKDKYPPLRQSKTNSLVRRRASDPPRSTAEDLARARTAMDGPIDTSDIPERKGPFQRLHRDATGRLPKNHVPVPIDPEDVRYLIKMDLTDRQAGIFLYLFQFTLQHGYQPSIRELCDEFAIASPNGVMVHLKALAHKGWISLSGGESRAVRFLRTPGGGRFVGLVEREE